MKTRIPPGDVGLSDDAPDRMHELADTPDAPGFINPMSLGNMNKAQRLEQEKTMLEMELRLLRGKYGLDSEEDSREALFRDEIEAEVRRTREFIYTPEGEYHIRQTILRDLTRPQPHPQAESDALFRESYSDRLRREHEAEKEKERGEE